MPGKIRSLYGRKAKKLVKRELPCDDILIDRWLHEEHDIRVKIYYIKNDDGEIYAIALLSLMDFDPLRKQANPWCFDYIFTKPQYRRQGYGHKLISYIKEYEQVNAHCSTKESFCMFIQAGYKPYFGSSCIDGFTFLLRSE